MEKPTDLISGQEIEQFRQTNLGRLIEDIHFFFDRSALKHLRDSGFPMIKSADAHVMRTMRIEGTRVTDMANQAGISKQAMSKLVATFVANGFLMWSDDPNDKRNRIVLVTDAGRDLLISGIAALRRAENDITDIIGPDELEQFREVLIKIKLAKNIRPLPALPQDRKRRM